MKSNTILPTLEESDSTSTTEMPSFSVSSSVLDFGRAAGTQLAFHTDFQELLSSVLEERNKLLIFLREKSECLPFNAAGNVKRCVLLCQSFVENSPGVDSYQCTCPGGRVGSKCELFAYKALLTNGKLTSILRNFIQRNVVSQPDSPEWMQKWEVSLQTWAIRLFAKLYSIYNRVSFCRGANEMVPETIHDPFLSQQNLGNCMRAVLKPYRALNAPVLDALFDILIGKNKVKMDEDESQALEAFLRLEGRSDPKEVQREKEAALEAAISATSLTTHLSFISKKVGNAKILSQDITEPSVFTTIIECLGHCKEELYAGYFEHVNLLLMSNPRNTIRILGEKHWQKLIVVIFEHCSLPQEGDEKEDQQMELTSKHLEVAILDKKGFVMKVSLLSMMLCNALSYESDSKKTRQYILESLMVMSAMTPVSDKEKEDKQSSTNSTFLLTPLGSQSLATPRRSKRTSFFGRSFSVEPSASVRTAIDMADQRKIDSFNNNVSRIVLFSILKRIMMTNFHAMSDPMSNMWTNVLTLFDLIVDFVFHLNPEHSPDFLGQPNLKIKVEDRVDIPDIILTTTALKLTEKYLAKDDFNPDIVLPDKKKSFQARVSQIKTMSKLFQSMNSFFKLSMHPPVKTNLYSPRGPLSDGKDSSSDESVFVSSIKSVKSGDTPRNSAKFLSAEVFDGLSSEQKKKMNDSIRRISSTLYHLRIESSDQITSSPIQKTRTSRINFLGGDKKKHVDQFSTALVELIQQAWSHSGYQATLAEEVDLEEAATTDVVKAKDDENMVVLQDKKVGWQTIRRREHKYAQMLADQIVAEAYGSDATQAMIQLTPQSPASPLNAKTRSRRSSSVG